MENCKLRNHKDSLENGDNDCEIQTAQNRDIHRIEQYDQERVS
jgi:hypothetical protein